MAPRGNLVRHCALLIFLSTALATLRAENCKLVDDDARKLVVEETGVAEAAQSRKAARSRSDKMRLGTILRMRLDVGTARRTENRHRLLGVFNYKRGR